jgi:hypothetical protein
MNQSFVVDWQNADEVKPVSAFVSVRMRGRKAGLYRVKKMMQEGVLLSHGAISFPVGTQLDIEGLHGIPFGAQEHARVVANDQHGVRLAWPAAS